MSKVQISEAHCIHQTSIYFIQLLFQTPPIIFECPSPSLVYFAREVGRQWSLPEKNVSKGEQINTCYPILSVIFSNERTQGTIGKEQGVPTTEEYVRTVSSVHVELYILMQ
jgi:hypothetical protein